MGGVSSTTRRGWLDRGGGKWGGEGVVVSVGNYEIVPLSAEGREGDGEFELTENAVGKRI